MFVKLIATVGLLALGAVNTQAKQVSNKVLVAKAPDTQKVVVAKADDKKGETPRAAATDGGTAAPKKGAKSK